jgi:molecular chaperone GrpE
MEEIKENVAKVYSETEYKSLEDKYLRAVAEHQNYKRRMEIDLGKKMSTAKEQVLQDLIILKDDFERGLTTVPESLTKESWFTGFALVFKRYGDVLSKHDVTEIPSQQEFDPNIHDPILSETKESEENSVEVVEQFLKGYKLKDKVLRPARVKVLRKEKRND